MEAVLHGSAAGCQGYTMQEAYTALPAQIILLRAMHAKHLLVFYKRIHARFCSAASLHCTAPLWSHLVARASFDTELGGLQQIFTV